MTFQRDPAGTMARYKSFIALGGTQPLPDLYAAAGARLVFDRDGMAELVELAAPLVDRIDRCVVTGPEDRRRVVGTEVRNGGSPAPTAQHRGANLGAMPLEQLDAREPKCQTPGLIKLFIRQHRSSQIQAGPGS